MIAYCGLHCDTCPIHLATIEQDPQKKLQMRREVANALRDRHGLLLSTNDVPDCDGCTLETGRLFFSCAKCKVRACARERQHDSCAYCTDYPCEKLQEVFADQLEAKVELEKLRQ
ncbi:MAG: DUF3795 domain-containing protein [Bacteroidota bacterium]|nr:DUF3795 domain-containing protein [Bacteroidota bacterium]